MSTWLIELSFGPVQGFIAAARSSRDLWSGSRLLSGVARAAGKALLARGAQLIYPVERRVREDAPEETSNLSNVLLARVELPDAQAATALAREAQQAARSWLQETGDHARGEWEGAGVAIRREIWQRQIADALDSYAAWSELKPGETYRDAYDRVKEVLAARKNTRDFAPMFEPGQAQLGLGVPKSSLDGMRESVLPEKHERFPQRFHVARGEQLDALGCIKRVEGRTERFTALTRLAADGWLQGLAAAEREALCHAYEPLVALDYATRAQGNDGCYGDFPYDAGLLYPERLESALRDAREVQDEAGHEALRKLRDKLRPLWKAHGQPCPYAAILMADGDRMGAFIDQAKEAAQHNAMSDAIAGFSDQVPATLRTHRGHCLYNGGEDVMALLPLGSVIEAARALAGLFNTKLKPVADQVARDKSDHRPSLRVGVAICHVQEPLGLIRQYGDAAEKFAKGEAGTAHQGNALGLRLHERAGHVVGWRGRFDEPAQFAALADWCADFTAGRIAGKLPYRIRERWLAGRETGLSNEVIDNEVRRVLKQASQRGGEGGLDASRIEAIQQRAKALSSKDDATGYGRLVDELILARWLSARNAAELGRGNA